MDRQTCLINDKPIFTFLDALPCLAFKLWVGQEAKLHDLSGIILSLPFFKNFILIIINVFYHHRHFRATSRYDSVHKSDKRRQPESILQCMLLDLNTIQTPKFRCLDGIRSRSLKLPFIKSILQCMLPDLIPSKHLKREFEGKCPIHG